MSGQRILEVIVCSVDDAVEAQKGGATRLEIVRDLEQGGLTPAFEMVQDIKNAVDLPLRVMVRESVGYQTHQADEIEKLCSAAQRFGALGVDGLVLGYLNDGVVDIGLTEQILRCAPDIKATFHHAFEGARDQLQALNSIKRLAQVDRILANGGSGALSRRIERLDKYVRLGSPELTIIAGGGIDMANIGQIAHQTSVTEFHVGRAARTGNQVAGPVNAKLVSNLIRRYHS